MFVASYVTATGEVATLEPMPTEIAALAAGIDAAAAAWDTFDLLFPELYDEPSETEALTEYKAFLPDYLGHPELDGKTLVLIERR